MNELNLQNSEFRKRIRGIRIQNKRLYVVYTICLASDWHFNDYLYSDNDLIDDHQRWFTSLNYEVTSLHEFDLLKDKNRLSVRAKPTKSYL